MKKKVLFVIHDLGQGGAEKVLINLVNNLDRTKFDITVMALFGGGVNEQFLKKDIRLLICYKSAFPGNSHLMKLFTPGQLYRHYIREHYDVVISYLEGPSARIVSGCPDSDTKLVSWIHCTMDTLQKASRSFRTIAEAQKCYNRFDRLIFVSECVKGAFRSVCPVTTPCEVLYNTNETGKILAASREKVEESVFTAGEIRICGMGKLTQNKGFDRLLRIHRKLQADGYPVHTYILGEGEERASLEQYMEENGISDSVTLLGYQTNPYKFVRCCDLYVCTSHTEGFSTAATEALVVGTPVCTVEVSGMKEMLGENNEWGIVTENDEDALYEGIRHLLDDPGLLAHYREQALLRGRTFRTENTVGAVEEMLENL
ncbi:glycosyltransferase [Anaeromassilibacillus senegalensis]|uniref:Glycosyltransferase n=1 Tax=Anaeromassilibacillus senegalensis TaxID=1673717 RepID=A0ABS9CNK0_9FIRM|nr:glycosyltransferase [Anaeromassilibacillus senegalensis]MCF2652704.1 glycosyltransferase [Anaeromassilibacillus senegalensis]